MTTFSNWFSKLLAVFGAGALLALAACGEKPKQFETVTTNIGGLEFTDFSTKHLPSQQVQLRPTAGIVRLLLGLKEGGMIHFELAPNRISKAVTHRTVEEIWYFVAGRGQVWRKQNGHAAVVDVYPGVSLTIPLGYSNSSFGHLATNRLLAIAVTMPPWPGEGEGIIVKGEWEPSQP